MRRLRLTTAAFALGCLTAAPLFAAESPAADATTPAKPTTSGKKKTKTGDNQVLITADQISHDRDLNTVNARGHVEVGQNGKTLLADNLSYNLKQDVIIATGNVSLTETTGEVTFADYMELTGDMKEAAARGVRLLMIDDSRMAANTAHRMSGKRTVFQQGVYSACKACEDDPGKTPLWQIKANRITHDENTHLVEYEDAWMEMQGIPLLYTPYASHSDPTVKRESGFLTPTVMDNDIIGNGVRVPYFWVLSPYQDLTLAPLYTTDQGTELASTYRWRGSSGEAKTTASVVQEPAGGVTGKAQLGWHIDSAAQFAVTDSWRAGWNVQQASDSTFLETYGYHPSLPYLSTHPYVENFDYRNYASISAYSFQSLTESVTNTGTNLQKRPLVLPLASYDYVGDPGAYGSYWTFDTHTASITRNDNGTDDRRINTQTAWKLPYTASTGEVYSLSASVRADAYNSDNLTATDGSTVNATRLSPQVSIDWRFPLTKVGEHSSQVITPVVVASAAPTNGNSAKIPNEDSLDFELDDINIFSPQPFTGYDRVAEGSRVAYGAEYSIANRGIQVADMMIGQSYQTKPDKLFMPGNGLDQTISDIVGRENITPSQNVSFNYRYRLDPDNFTLKRSEIGTVLGPQALNLNMNYAFFDKLAPTSPFNRREQLATTLSMKLSRYYTTQLYNTENLGSGAGPLQTGARVTYEDECFLLTADGGASHTTVATFSAGHYAMLRVVFKTITEFPVNFF
ncbi:MAG TPA: LPS assembly protein LptD [Patescibacteria group bacterium]|nr:LPS assembly protein LptD [Patescibacteria group bacterium]